MVIIIMLIIVMLHSVFSLNILFNFFIAISQKQIRYTRKKYYFSLCAAFRYLPFTAYTDFDYRYSIFDPVLRVPLIIFWSIDLSGSHTLCSFLGEF